MLGPDRRSGSPKSCTAWRAPPAPPTGFAIASSDVRVRWAREPKAALLRDLSNDGLAFEVSDSDIEKLLPGRALEDLQLSYRGRVCVSGVRALVRHVKPPGGGRPLPRRLRAQARRRRADRW